MLTCLMLAGAHVHGIGYKKDDNSSSDLIKIPMICSDRDTFVDGGLVANDPTQVRGDAQCALRHALYRSRCSRECYQLACGQPLTLQH